MKSMKSKDGANRSPPTTQEQQQQQESIARKKQEGSWIESHTSCTSNTISGRVLSWLSSIAIFGDSGLALIGSFLLLLLAVGVALRIGPDSDKTGSLANDVIIDKTQLEIEESYKKLGPIPEIGPPIIHQVSIDSIEDKDASDSKTPSSHYVTEEMKQSFEKDGVIAIRGLIPSQLLDRLGVASDTLIQKNKVQQPKEKIITGRKKAPSQFHTVHEGAIFLNLTTTTTSETAKSTNSSSSSSDDDSLLPPFYEVALKSVIPQIAAELLFSHDDDNSSSDINSKESSSDVITEHNNINDRNLRILRDIFLSKDEEEYICGWHVDDTGFWPATYEATGINAWIAIDDMPPGNGGGFAVAVGSHTASWANDAYEVTGSTHTFPPGGFASANDLLDNRAGNGTCNIKTTAPHIHRRMEETKRIYDVRKGDVIFHTRWLFHRTVPFERSAVIERHKSLNSEPLVYRRYSVRYGPGLSVIQPGFGMEPSVLWSKENGGRTADEVAEVDAAWYPMAWPPQSSSSAEEEYRQMKMIATERLPEVTEKSKSIRKHLQRQRSDKQRQRFNRQPH